MCLTNQVIRHKRQGSGVDTCQLVTTFEIQPTSRLYLIQVHVCMHVCIVSSICQPLSRFLGLFLLLSFLYMCTYVCVLHSVRRWGTVELNYLITKAAAAVRGFIFVCSSPICHHTCHKSSTVPILQLHTHSYKHTYIAILWKKNYSLYECNI